MHTIQQISKTKELHNYNECTDAIADCAKGCLCLSVCVREVSVLWLKA